MSRSANDGTPAPESLRKRKEPGYILWAFSNEDDYEELYKRVKEGPRKAILVTKKYGNIVPRSIIAIGEISLEDLIPKEDEECQKWNYWPKNPEEQGKGWRYKFFVKIKDIAPGVKASISKLEQMNDEEFLQTEKLEEVLREWASSAIVLVPGNLIRGSLVEVSEEVFNEVYLLAESKWKESIDGMRMWDHKQVLTVLENQKVLIPLRIVEEAVSALKMGKHLLLVGVPGSGKTTLARAIAQAFGMGLVETTACSEWSRVDLIGGPVFVGGKVVWKCGALLTAIAKYYRSVKEGGRGVLLLIDEMNRANLDKSFGEFFTIFGSSDPDTWYIPESILLEMQEYYNSGAIDEWGKYLLELWRNQNKSVGLKIPRNFRVIGTINTYDRRYLFTLGQALLRRFALVEVTTPSIEELRSCIDKLSEKIVEELSKLAKDSSSINIEKEKVKQILDIHKEKEKVEKILDILIELYEVIYKTTKLELGLGLLIDVAKLAYELSAKYESSAKNNDLSGAVDRAFCMIVLSQLESLSPHKLKEVADALVSDRKDGKHEELRRAIERFYPEILLQQGNPKMLLEASIS